MKKNAIIIKEDSLHDELSQSELLTVNGGDDGTLAYLAGYSYVFTMAHFLTGGLSTIHYLTKKLN